MSIVSGSRVAGPPHVGHVVLMNAASLASGEPCPVNCTPFGSSTGSWPSGTATVPWVGQYTIGIGVPQYRCRETSQSRMR